jgi:hypothetical protein
MQQRARAGARPRAVEDIVDLLQAQIRNPLEGLVRL